MIGALRDLIIVVLDLYTYVIIAVAGTEPPLTDAHEKAVHQFAAAMIASRKVPDAEFAAIEKTLEKHALHDVIHPCSAFAARRALAA